LYNGNSAYEKGAIVTRTAASFVRFGSFEILAAQRDVANLKTLVNYTMKHSYTHLGKPSKKMYVEFFKEVAQRNLEMVIHWQRIGFVHGVMNTDNMSILGLTIDYGPYGWLEGYDLDWTPNTTDSQFKRYRYGNQPDIVLWNLYQLANALYPLIQETQGLEEVLSTFKDSYNTKYIEMMRSKLGLAQEDENDLQLVENLEVCLQLTETDMTIFFRNLSAFSTNNSVSPMDFVKDAFYNPTELSDDIVNQWKKWFKNYANRLQLEKCDDENRKIKMNLVNPKYVLRNYMAQLAIDAADKGEYNVLNELFQLLKRPYDEQPEHTKWFVKRPEWARHKVGCSMLSCSS
jgi:uncharacterized protein YdiU (UPF0061 family)